MFYWMKSSILLMVGGLSNMGEWRRLWAGKFEFVFRSTAPTYTLIYNQSTCWLEHLHDLPDSHVLPWCAVVVVVLLKSMNLEDISSTKRYSVIQQTYHWNATCRQQLEYWLSPYNLDPCQGRVGKHLQLGNGRWFLPHGCCFVLQAWYQVRGFNDNTQVFLN